MISLQWEFPWVPNPEIFNKQKKTVPGPGSGPGMLVRIVEGLLRAAGPGMDPIMVSSIPSVVEQDVVVIMQIRYKQLLFTSR